MSTSAEPPRTGRRLMQLRARDIMTAPVITAPPDATIRELVELMTARRISGVPIVSAAGELLGIVTEGDLLYKELAPRPEEPPGLVQRLLPFPGIAAAADRARKAEAVRASELMTSPVVTVAEDAPVHEIAALMTRHGINRVPVVRDGRVVGIVSRNDVLKAFTRSDEELAAAIREALLHDLWIDISRIQVTAHQGVVALDGRVERWSEKELAGKWAALADGVVRVENRLLYDLDDRKVPPEAPRLPGERGSKP
ncbi:MAG: CBS domain-containing protein [Armatimonadota bacterium]|nr:CBS domain-containing protein [Armatimonadota bacterium]MDR7485470.1 CBS domain-containing protein [Armatimonadota bacterium]MDR7533015.1 CBS domain-containing protein [Armatimonadota bacterium]MDR7536813.1 CBS domain-containing protein [Armatimonadota bacterium]